MRPERISVALGRVRCILDRCRTVSGVNEVSARLLDGKAIAQEIKAELAESVIEFIENNGTVPTLAAILVGEDPASEVYVRNKRKACEQVGVESQLHRLPRETDQEQLLEVIARLNKSHEVHGILVQLPLPKHIDTARVSWMRSAPGRMSTPFTRKTSAGSRRGVLGSCPARRTASSSCSIAANCRYAASTS